MRNGIYSGPRAHLFTHDFTHRVYDVTSTRCRHSRASPPGILGSDAQRDYWRPRARGPRSMNFRPGGRRRGPRERSGIGLSRRARFRDSRRYGRYRRPDGRRGGRHSGCGVYSLLGIRQQHLTANQAQHLPAERRGRVARESERDR